MLTRFCTSTWAMSGLVPSLNVTVSRMAPSLVACDSMYIIPSTPFTCSSIGAATVSDDGPGVGPGVGRGDDHLRRHHVRVLGDRQLRQREHAAERDQHREHHREHGPGDEELHGMAIEGTDGGCRTGTVPEQRTWARLLVVDSPAASRRSASPFLCSLDRHRNARADAEQVVGDHRVGLVQAGRRGRRRPRFTSTIPSNAAPGSTSRSWALPSATT